MAKVVVLGAGIAGHTAALFLRRKLSREHQVVVVSPKDVYNWIPSNIWVGVGIMSASEVVVPLKPVYNRIGVEFIQGKATEIHPEGSAQAEQPFIVVESTASGKSSERREIPYDYLINATGPKLNFGATPGLGPEGFTESVCTFEHAEHAAKALSKAIAKMKAGERQTIVIGTGHGLGTCEGAAFEYILNVEFELRRHGVRDKARVVFLTNESELGDFGVGGLHIRRGGYVVQSKTFAESLFAEREVEWITGAHTQKVEKDRIHYETLDGHVHELGFDFAMLLPPFSGAGMKVDADYTQKKYEEWKASDWPRHYRNPKYENIYAIGIAFAPPHPISMPQTSKNGTPNTPSPPRTGMPSAIMGRNVALNIADRINGRENQATRTSSMSEMGAACVASAGVHWWSGSAASMTMYPIVPNYERFPQTGRDLEFTFGDIGSAGHWIKKILHYTFIYKAKAKPLWWIIPE